MKKILIAIGIVAILVCLLAVPVVADRNGPAGNSSVGHLYLYEKNPSTWQIVEGGAWGKMTYRLSGESFSCVFNGHGLELDVNYSLIKYTDPWPGTPVVVIASGIANDEGNIHLSGSADLGAYGSGFDGYKVWLIVSSHLTGDTMSSWHPTRYLFEHDLIR